jgi:hypothetical protein
MRTYEGLWKELLSTKSKTLKVKCSKRMPIERLVKAVFKEKDLDRENREKWKLHAQRFPDKSVVVFSLAKKYANYEV